MYSATPLLVFLLAASPVALQAAERREATLVAANPIRKVVNLLKGMQSKVEAEGAKAEDLYNKFMCYCKTAGDSLKAQIAGGGAKGPALASSIEEAESQLTTSKADL